MRNCYVTSCETTPEMFSCLDFSIGHFFKLKQDKIWLILHLFTCLIQVGFDSIMSWIMLIWLMFAER